ncbi:MAG: hypothetical protein ACLFP8_04340 [Alphaproteobacteria bacterium]
MLNRFLYSSALRVLFFASACICPFELNAQVQDPDCSVPYETVTRLYTPDLGASMVWQRFYNQYGITAKGRQARFVSSYVLDDQGVMVAGLVWPMTNVRPALMLVRFDDRGRGQWEQVHNLPDLEEVVKIIPDGDGSLVLANLSKPDQHSSLWFGFFDKDGQLKSSKILEESNFDLRARDIHSSVDGEGWVVPVTVSRDLGGDPPHLQQNATVYLLNRQGDKVAMRSYILGLQTELLHVHSQTFAGEKKGYIATGYFENGAGKKIGWIMRLDPDLSIVWQREYSRGILAKIITGASDGSGDVLLAGDVNSAESDVGGVWLAKLDGVRGDVLWQRYYASQDDLYNYRTKALVRHEDGRISLLMAGEPVADEGAVKRRFQEQVDDRLRGRRVGYLLTLTARGTLLTGDSFYAGYKSYVSSMAAGQDGRRFMVGDSWLESYEALKRAREENMPEGTPLHEYGEIQLPDVRLSDKARQGLALLKKEISAQDIIDTKQEALESAKSSSGDLVLLQKGWAFVSQMDEAYIDPCE